MAGIHELATADGVNPFVVDDRSLAADALPLEVDILDFHVHSDEVSVLDFTVSLQTFLRVGVWQKNLE